MRVKDCEGCRHCERRTWVQRYKPADYHPIGYTHAYAFCKKHNKRVSEVKSCNENKTRGGE